MRIQYGGLYFKRHRNDVIAVVNDKALSNTIILSKMMLFMVDTFNRNRNIDKVLYQPIKSNK